MNLTESIAIGLVFGFFFYERFGLSAGGFVVPGYIALQFNNPLLLGGTLVVSILTWLLVRAASRCTILYGRRRFILMVLTGFAWQWGFRLLMVRTGSFIEDGGRLRVHHPGADRERDERQGIAPTLTALLVISAWSA